MWDHGFGLCFGVNLNTSSVEIDIQINLQGNMGLTISGYYPNFTWSYPVSHILDKYCKTIF